MGGVNKRQKNQGGAVVGVQPSAERGRRNLAQDWGRKVGGTSGRHPVSSSQTPPTTYLPCSLVRQVREELLTLVRGAGGSWLWGWHVRRRSGPFVESATPSSAELRELLTGWLGVVAA